MYASEFYQKPERKSVKQSIKFIVRGKTRCVFTEKKNDEKLMDTDPKHWDRELTDTQSKYDSYIM